MGASGQNRLCIVDHVEITAEQDTIECLKCKVPYHQACWDYVQKKCVFQICAWGRVCPVDQVAIPENEAASVCPQCQTVYHRRCWVRTGKCDRPGCSPAGKTGPRSSRSIFQALRQLPRECWPCGHEKEGGATRCWVCEPASPKKEDAGTSGPPSVGCSILGFGLGAFFLGVLFLKHLGPGDSLVGMGIFVLAGGVLGGYLAKRAGRLHRERLARIPAPPKPTLAPTLLSRSLDRQREGDLLGSEADATAVLTINPDSCEAYLLRSAARYPGTIEGSYLDLGKALRLEPSTLDGYAILLLLRILYFHLRCLISVTNLGHRFPMPQTSLCLGAEALLEGRFPEAVSHFNSVVDHPADGMLAQLGLALVTFWQGDLVGTIRKLVAIQTDDPRVLRFQAAVRMMAK